MRHLKTLVIALGVTVCLPIAAASAEEATKAQKEPAASSEAGRNSGGLIRIGAPEYFDLHTLSSLLGQFSARYPAVSIQIELGIGPDISAIAWPAPRLRTTSL